MAVPAIPTIMRFTQLMLLFANALIWTDTPVLLVSHQKFLLHSLSQFVCISYFIKLLPNFLTKQMFGILYFRRTFSSIGLIVGRTRRPNRCQRCGFSYRDSHCLCGDYHNNSSLTIPALFGQKDIISGKALPSITVLNQRIWSLLGTTRSMDSSLEV